MQDQGKTGLAQMRQGVATVIAMGAELSRPLCLVLLAEVAGHGEGLLEADCGPAHLGHQQGKCDPARELLAPIYGWFTEGFDTADLREVQALLADLPAPG
jgi:hypothetical protein